MSQVYGVWKVLKQLGEGGQAHIFLVENISSKQVAVLKRLKNKNRIDRFKTELRVMEEHREENFFPRIYDSDLDAERPYVVMERFEQGHLTEELIKNWSRAQKLAFYIHLIRAVGYANDAGVIHRDLKPGNILVTNDNLPRVTDFGICYFEDDGTRQTRVDEAVGSFRFMAPEMEDGRSDRVGQHTDIYSIGKIGYWLFSGKIYNREKHRDPQFDLTKQGTDAWRYFFNDFLDKVTAHEPEDRPQVTVALINEFDQVRCAMMDDVRYLDLKIDQVCMFCKSGTYRVSLNALDGANAASIEDFGFKAVGKPMWLLMCCNQCGNMQSFRKDLCEKWSWKE